MKKTLVVMRHGKAMPLAQDQRDHERSLTPAGAAALEAQLPRMLSLLDEDRTVQLWASRATRARQTAELAQAALRQRGIRVGKRIKQHTCLWKQDVDEFLQHLRDAEADVVFAVGHVPFVEDVVEELTGFALSFSTGAACCLEVEFADEPPVTEAAAPDADVAAPDADAAAPDADVAATAASAADPEASEPTAPHARLLWFAQGPVAANWDTLIQLQATLTMAAEAIEERRAAFFANPQDTEAIHRFRTNIRTLRSFLAFIKPWQNKKQNAQTQDVLKEIVRYTSRLRELNVLERQMVGNPDSSPKLLASCQKETQVERAKVKKILSSRRVAKLFEEAMRSAKNVAWKGRIARCGLPADVVRARFDAMVASVENDVAQLDLRDAEQTHDVRKRIKRVRYVAEFNSGILGEDAVDTAQRMIAEQDRLGDVCDARANNRLVDEFLARSLPKAVGKGFAAMRKQNDAFLSDALEAVEP